MFFLPRIRISRKHVLYPLQWHGELRFLPWIRVGLAPRSFFFFFKCWMHSLEPGLVNMKYFDHNVHTGHSRCVKVPYTLDGAVYRALA